VNLTQSIIGRIRAQFGRPSGFSGRVRGWIMASRPSNRRRNVWAVSLLEVQRRDRVLEIGFGPGLAVREISRLAVEGCVCGLDHSEEYCVRPRSGTRPPFGRARSILRLGSADRLPLFAEPFDKVLAVNAIMFRDQTMDRLKALRRVMRPGGRIAIAHQPRGPGVTDVTAAARGEAIAAALTQAGFSEVRLRTMMLKPTVACAIGVNPCDGGVRP
jgi:SAM-dependent methyltransferase